MIEEGMRGVLDMMQKRVGTSGGASSSKRPRVDTDAPPPLARASPSAQKVERAEEGPPRRRPRTAAPGRPLPESVQEQGWSSRTEPYIKDFLGELNDRFLDELESYNVDDLCGALQRLTSCTVAVATRLKAKTQDSLKQLQAEIQSLRQSLEQLQEENTKLQEENSTLTEKAVMSDFRATQFKRELSLIREELLEARKDLDVQRLSFERTMEGETSRLQGQVDSLKVQLATEYNDGVAFSYNCLMYALGKEHPEVDLTKVQAGVAEYMRIHDIPIQESEASPSEAPTELREVAPPPPADAPAAAADDDAPPASHDPSAA